MPPDPSELAALAEAVAREAGTMLLDGQVGTRSMIATKTSATDMVSEMDHAAEALIIERLLAARPGDGILGEEGGERRGTSGVRWVVDPLDGTTNYLYGQPAWSVSIAAEVDGTGVAGVVYDPSHGECFTAAAGAGAYLNGEPIAPSGADDLSSALVATGFAYDAGRRARQAHVLTHVLPRVRDIRRYGAASLDLCWVACGRQDGYYEVGLQPWDVAAGAVIAAESGAMVCGVDGGPPGGPSILTAAPGLALTLLGLLKMADAAGSL
ncbi:MAG: inositol monophosphatase family protein [Acidimicrobiia bacterium]